MAAAATMTDAGTVSVELVFDRETEVPPAGAALVRVTVQVLVALGPRLVGEHTSEETNTAAESVMLVFAELPL